MNGGKKGGREKVVYLVYLHLATSSTFYINISAIKKESLFKSVVLN